MAENSNRPMQGQIRFGSQIRQIGKGLQKRRKRIRKIGKRIQFVIRWADRLRNLLWNMRIRNFMTK